MHLVSIMGSYRKGKTIDTLLDKAIEGVQSVKSDVTIDKINLVEKHIEYCKNCHICKKDIVSTPLSSCPIQDDMQEIYSMLIKADVYIFGTPVNFGHETAIMKTFIERIAYVLARPNPNSFPVAQIPEPRMKNISKRAIIVVSSGIVPPLFKMFCDQATPLITEVCKTCLNAKVIGSLYAGAIDKVGVQTYFNRAYQLGKKLINI